MLNNAQRNKVLEWIAAGKSSPEIIVLASQFSEPFRISKDSVYRYKKSRGIDSTSIIQGAESDAIRRGLAVRENRIAKLEKLAAMMEKDLFKSLWVTKPKFMGKENVIDVEEFNTAEVEQYRGILDDIAREVGDRKQVHETPSAVVVPLELINDIIKKAYGDGTDSHGGA